MRGSIRLNSPSKTHAAIWAVVRRIPRGCVATYGQVAAEAGFRKQPRLAGYALHAAPADVPWHRVINAQGRISLPAGSDAALAQKKLLMAEGVAFKGERVDLNRYRWAPLATSGRPPSSRAPLLD